MEILLYVFAIIGFVTVMSFIGLVVLAFLTPPITEPNELNPDDQYTYDRMNGLTNNEDHVIF